MTPFFNSISHKFHEDVREDDSRKTSKIVILILNFEFWGSNLEPNQKFDTILEISKIKILIFQ